MWALLTGASECLITQPHTQQVHCLLGVTHQGEYTKCVCVIKFIRVSIQTFGGGQDDTQISLQGATENHTRKDGTAGAGLAVARFQTNDRREHSIGEKLEIII